MIGRMNQRIRLQAQVETADGAGGVTVAWADLPVNPVVWAEVTPKAGREQVVENRVVASFVATFTIWNRFDLTERHRIIWNNEVWNIRGILRAGMQTLRLKIEAERGVAG